jgi:hypothetical protein
VKKTKGYLVVCIICYVITFPLIPLYLLLDRGERRRARDLLEKMDQGHQPGYWDKLVQKCWVRC